MKIQIDRYTNQVAGLNGPAAAVFLEIDVEDGFNPSKLADQVEGEVQKTNDDGQPLYLNSQGEEVTEPEEDGQQLPPVMVPIIVQRTVTLLENPQAFTLDDVVQAKYRELMDSADQDHLIADVFLGEADLDLTDPNHNANTGVGICEILPLDQVKTKPIQLESPAQTFQLLELDADDGIEMYVAGQPFVNGVVTLAAPVESCTLKFVNTTDKPASARAYAVGY